MRLAHLKDQAARRLFKAAGRVPRVWLAMVALAPPGVARAQTDSVEYYGTDALGSVRVVYDSAGTLVSRADYLPFGEDLTPAEGLPTERFTGQARDPEAGKDYFNARMYHPRTGRFAASDPVLGSSHTWNRYSYALGNPLSFTDPTGLQADSCTRSRIMVGDQVVYDGSLQCDASSGGRPGGAGGGGYWGSGGDPSTAPILALPPVGGEPYAGPGWSDPSETPPTSTQQETANEQPPPPPTLPPYKPRPPARPPAPQPLIPPGARFGICVGLSTLALALPVETAITMSCVGTGPGFGLCVWGAHEAALPALTFWEMTVAGACAAFSEKQ